MHRSLEPNGGVGGYYVHGGAQTYSNYNPQGYIPQQSAGMQFYAQQPMTSQQMMAWATTPSDGEFDYTSSEYTTSTREQRTTQHQVGQGQNAYGVTSQSIPQLTQRSSGSGTALKSASSGSLNFLYSEDEEANGIPKGRSLFSAGAMGKQSADYGGGGSNGSGGNGFNAGAPSGSLGGGPGQGSQKAVGTNDAKSAAAAAASSGTGSRLQPRSSWQRKSQLRSWGSHRR